MAAELKFVDSHNIVGYLLDPPVNHKEFKSMIAGLYSCRISHAIRATPVIYKVLINDFWKNATINKEGADGASTVESTVRGTKMIISEQTVRRVLEFGDQPEFPIEFPAARVLEALELMCYEGVYPPTMKKLLPPFWRFLAHTFVNCISGRKGGSDEISQTATSAIVALVMEWDYNFSKFVFEEMKSNLTAKKDLFLMYPRFLQMIFNEEYPLIERTGDTLDVKALSPNTFGLMKQSRKSATISFQGLKPLVKLGKFADQEEQLNAAVVNENPESSTPKTTLQIPRQFCMEEIEEISDDEDDVEPQMTELEFEEAINQSITQTPQVEVDPEPAQQPKLSSDTVQPSVIVDTSEDAEDDDDDDPTSNLIHRKRKRNDLHVEELVQDKIVDQEQENPTVDSSQMEQVNASQTVEETVQSPTNESTPMDQDQIFQPVDDVVIPTDAGHVAGSSSMPSDLNVLKGKNLMFDSEPVNVVKMQNRVFVLEKENAEKDLLIGKLDIRVSNLEKDKAEKDSKITSLENDLGNLTSLLLDMKQHMSQRFGNIL